MVEALGQKTLVSMANAGPEQQAQLLQGLGLSGYILTDGNNPINLFGTGEKLLGAQQ
jgi:major vault protein